MSFTSGRDARLQSETNSESLQLFTFTQFADVDRPAIGAFQLLRKIRNFIGEAVYENGSRAASIERLESRENLELACRIGEKNE